MYLEYRDTKIIISAVNKQIDYFTTKDKG